MTRKEHTAGYHYSGSLLAAISIPIFLIYFLFIVCNLGDEGSIALIQNPLFIISVATFIVVPPIVATVYCRRKNLTGLQEYINVSINVYVIAFLMFFYGFSKMKGKFFAITYLTQDMRVADLGSFELTWYYFGRSNVQEFMIGLLELVPALLILFRKTRLLGLLIMLPVSLNVLTINIFNHISGLTFIVSVVVAIANIYLLWTWKDEIIAFFRQLPVNSRLALSPSLRTARLVFKIIVLGTMAYTFLAMTIFRFVFTKKTYTQTNKFMGGFELDSLVVNGKPIHPETGNTKYYRSIYLEPQSRWNAVLNFESEFRPHAIKIKWNPDNDSVTTCLKTKNDIGSGAVDSSTLFRGRYILKDGKLFITGVQYGDSIRAVYYKKDLRDYKWFW